MENQYPDGDTRNVTRFTPEQRTAIRQALAEYEAGINKIFKPYLEDLSVPLTLKVGLRSQGHLPTVRKLRSWGESWETIAKAIGWDNPEGVRLWYLIEEDDEIPI